MGKHHTEIRQFRIFALVLGEDFFVGKTASPRISAVYSRHRCGSVAATRGTMDQEAIPLLYILEDLKCTGAEAYRHILAWIRRFEEEGYCSINHTGTAISSEVLHPHAEEILGELLKEPMNKILARTYVAKPSDGNRKPVRKLSLLPRKEKQVQMNLRMAEKDKKTFDCFCKKHNLRSREALGLLLDQITGENAHLQELLSTQKTIRQENENLKERMAVLQGTELSEREKQMETYLHFLKLGFLEYFQMLRPAEEGNALPVFPYKRFRKRSDIRYEYPKEECFLLLTAEALLWGQNHARFVVGRGVTGACLKLRYYPKLLYAGAFIWEYPAGTQFWVGCRRARDGAMELAASFPMPPMSELAEKSGECSELKQRMALDVQIRNAAAKK